MDTCRAENRCDIVIVVVFDNDHGFAFGRRDYVIRATDFDCVDVAIAISCDSVAPLQGSGTIVRFEKLTFFQCTCYGLIRTERSDGSIFRGELFGKVAH